MLALDSFSQFFKLFLLLASGLVLLASLDSAELAPTHQGEFFALLLSVTLGMLLLSSSINLAMLFLSFELVSLTSYIMVGYLKNDRLSNEASLKYILFGAIASGAMLYGFTLIYGMTGSLNLYSIRDAYLNKGLEGVDQFTVLLILVLTMAGFGFKTASVPFHFWCPDVYAGAATPVTAFLSIAPKAAGFAILVRFFFSGMSVAGNNQWSLMSGINWPLILIGISVLTMTLGNIAALTQNNLKRMLAYSSIAHAGYIMMGVVVLNGDGLRAILLYLVVYLFMNLGAFLVVTIIYNSDRTFDIEGYNGMFKRAPFLSVAMSIFMLSLIGIPPFAGFLGKLYIFGAVIQKGTRLVCGCRSTQCCDCCLLLYEGHEGHDHRRRQRQYLSRSDLPPQSRVAGRSPVTKHSADGLLESHSALGSLFSTTLRRRLKVILLPQGTRGDPKPRVTHTQAKI